MQQTDETTELAEARYPGRSKRFPTLKRKSAAPMCPRPLMLVDRLTGEVHRKIVRCGSLKCEVCRRVFIMKWKTHLLLGFGQEKLVFCYRIQKARWQKAYRQLRKAGADYVKLHRASGHAGGFDQVVFCTIPLEGFQSKANTTYEPTSVAFERALETAIDEMPEGILHRIQTSKRLRLHRKKPSRDLMMLGFSVMSTAEADQGASMQGARVHASGQGGHDRKYELPEVLLRDENSFWTFLIHVGVRHPRVDTLRAFLLWWKEREEREEKAVA